MYSGSVLGWFGALIAGARR